MNSVIFEKLMPIDLSLTKDCQWTDMLRLYDTLSQIFVLRTSLTTIRTSLLD
ncbi:MAG: hypothetical protein ACE5OZ_20350 [Candidatus Heimdallarchaeota archaeon]